MTFANTVRLSRSAAAVLAAAAFAVSLGGCASGDSQSSMSDNNTNSRSVTAQNTGSTKEDMTKYDTARAFPTGDKGSSVLLVEAMGPKSVRLNHEANCMVKVTNLTDMPVKNVMLMSTSPDGFKMGNVTGATAQPASADMGGKMGYAVGDLGPKESKTVTVTGTATKVGTIDTCYSVSYNPPTLCTNVMVTNPAIQLAVEAPADTDICKPVTYTYTVTNTGTGTAKNVTLEETLPDGLVTSADGKSMVSAPLGDIPQGQSRTAKAELKATKTGPLAGQAVAKSDGEATQPQDTKTTVHAPVLAVEVTGGKSDYVGRSVPFQITVTNKGDAPAMNAMVKVGHSGVGKVTAENVDSTGAISLGDLAPNASKTVTANAMSDAGGAATVIAEANAMCATAVSANGQATFNTIPAILLETVDEADPITVGQTVTYDITVTNQGSGPDNNLAVKAMIPDGEQYVSTSGPTQPTQDGQTLTFPVVGTLPTKQSVTWKVTVKAMRAGDVQFKTTATCDGTGAAEKTEPTKLVGQ